VFGQAAIVRMMCCFVVGMAIFRLWQITPTDRNGWASHLATISLLGIMIACVVPKGHAALTLLFAILLFALAFQHGIVSSLLSSPPLLFLGRISFPLYLVHGIVFWRLRYFMASRLATWSHTETFALLTVGFAFCIALSTLLNVAVERPAHVFGRRWARIGPKHRPQSEQTHFELLPSQSRPQA
jgi:peptidoglycan/LPS O-acetylase OafA/YrhL